MLSQGSCGLLSFIDVFLCLFKLPNIAYIKDNHIYTAFRCFRSNRYPLAHWPECIHRVHGSGNWYVFVTTGQIQSYYHSLEYQVKNLSYENGRLTI